MMVVSAVNWVSSNSTRPAAGAISSSSSRNKNEESPVAIWSPCCSHCSSTPAPFTWVPLRLSRSRTRNLPSCQLTKQCFRETEGSVTAIPFDASRPMVIDREGRGIVESFKGPESTRSLGRNFLTSRPFLSQFSPKFIPEVKLFHYPISEQIGAADRK